MSRTDFNEGKSIKIFAEALGSKDFISFNAYYTQALQLKPCEMPLNKVLDFIMNFTFVQEEE